MEGWRVSNAGLTLAEARQVRIRVATDNINAPKALGPGGSSHVARILELGAAARENPAQMSPRIFPPENLARFGAGAKDGKMSARRPPTQGRPFPPQETLFYAESG